MKNVWGEHIQPHEEKRKGLTRPKLTTLSLTAQDCHFYGHTWTKAGLGSEKLCTACGIKGYCMVCMQGTPPTDALPFLCALHTEGLVQA